MNMLVYKKMTVQKSKRYVKAQSIGGMSNRKNKSLKHIEQKYAFKRFKSEYVSEEYKKEAKITTQTKSSGKIRLEYVKKYNKKLRQGNNTKANNVELS